MKTTPCFAISGSKATPETNGQLATLPVIALNLLCACRSAVKRSPEK